MTLASNDIRKAKALLAADRREKRLARAAKADPAFPKLAGEPGEATARRFTPKQKAEAFIRQGGVCPDCGGRFALADLELDHRVPLALVGVEDASNHELLCGPCHAVKTKADVKRIAKAKRQAKLLQPREPSKRPIRSRGFQ